MATSKNMIPSIIAEESQKKGLDVIATGDALHIKWLEELEESLKEDKHTGIYTLSDEEYDTRFVITTEVEDSDRIHHLIIIPSIDVAYNMRDEFITKNIDADGRPKIRMKAHEIIKMFKEYDSIMDCYKQKVDFVELGLSADSQLADRLSQLHEYTFLTNSDSHSPWPHRIGREFNRIKVRNILPFDFFCLTLRTDSKNYLFTLK